MEKTIQIDGKQIKFKSGASFARIYKNQFGKDILTVIMPLLSEVLKNMDEIFDKKTIAPSDLSKILDSVYCLELVDIQNIIWAMAKLADKDIAEPEIWEGQFEEFPIFDVAKELMEIFIPSLVTKKKLLKELKIQKEQA